MTRQRKTKDPCPECFLHRSLCICRQIPSLTLKTKVVLVIHAKEMKRTTNTGRLAIKALVNSEMRVRGATTEPVDLSDLLTPEYQTLLFYPADEAVELELALIAKLKATNEKPIQLLVPDGNWRQASKVHHRHPELKDVLRVKISAPNLAEHHLRAESSEEGMSTLQAIAKALGIIEGAEVGSELEALYQAKLHATLKGRGEVLG